MRWIHCDTIITQSHKREDDELEITRHITKVQSGRRGGMFDPGATSTQCHAGDSKRMINRQALIDNGYVK